MNSPKKIKSPRIKFLNTLKKIRFAVFDFDGVFTDNRVLVSEDGREAVFCSRGDGLGLGMLKKAGVQIMVLSTEVNPVVGARCRKLSIDCLQGCADKGKKLREECRKRRIPLENVSFTGNDVNDRDCLAMAGLPICVADSHPDVLKYAKYVTRTKGGKGAVREICDLLLRSREKYE